MGTRGKDPQEVEQPREDLERIEATPMLIDINTFVDDLHELLSKDDDDIRKAKTNVFQWALRETGRKNDLHSQIIDRGQYAPSVINYYCDIYINLCNRYNKATFIAPFAAFLGIERPRVEEWGYLAKFANSPLRTVYQKLKDQYEDNVRSYAGDAASRGNGLAMALLVNHDHGWDKGQNLAQLGDSGPSTDAIVNQVGTLIAQKVKDSLESK